MFENNAYIRDILKPAPMSEFYPTIVRIQMRALIENTKSNFRAGRNTVTECRLSAIVYTYTQRCGGGADKL